MTRKESQEVFDQLCKDFEQVKGEKSTGIFLRDREVPAGMTYAQALYHYISLQKEYDDYDFFFTYPKDEDGETFLYNLTTEQWKKLDAEEAKMFDFEDEDE